MFNELVLQPEVLEVTNKNPKNKICHTILNFNKKNISSYIIPDSLMNSAN